MIQRRSVLLKCILSLVSCVIVTAASAAEMIDHVIFDPPSGTNDSRKEYPMRLLREILERTKKTYGAFDLQYAKSIIEQRPRLLLEMKSGNIINVTVQPTQPTWEAELATIRIPVDKGIPSYRIFLINKKNEAEFAAISNVEQLKPKRLGINNSWSTYAIHEANGFTMTSGSSYEGLFSMLVAERFDYFPRAIYEAIPEQLAHKDASPNIVVEKTIALYFPLPRYFFVSPAHPRLAKRIEAGFEMLVNDGTFDRLFMEYHEDLIKQAGFCSRRIFTIPNPFLSPETPLNRKELWFDPFHGTVIKGKREKAFCS